jgi:hypothetical protein
MKTKYTVPCPLSGLSIEMEHNSEDIYFPWAAFLHVDIGGWRPLFLNTCGETPMEACRALHDCLDTVRRVVWNFSSEREDVESMLDLLWKDTLNIEASDHVLSLNAAGGA